MRPDRGRRGRRFGRYALLSVLAAIVLFPLYIAVVSSLLDLRQLTSRPPTLFPTHPQWQDYSTAFRQGNLGLFMRNSFIQSAIIVTGQVITSVLAGYAFAFLRFPLKRTLFAVFLATLMVPFEVTMVTNLVTISHLGWYNTFQGLTVPFLASGLGTFLMRQAFLQIPPEMREAAALDGYGNLRFMMRVAVPLARPTVAALAVYSFLGAWNQYLWPLLVTGDNNAIRTVQIGLKQLAATQIQDIPVTLAGTVIAVAPLLVLLLVFQKQLVRGLTAGAVK
ncbi:MAG TPA: carbohydrate ABC transporter permease [Acidimicrobiales bacterium]|nr:carbohydrate ABC transporter permease [Acidimicrobiales bacterium]